MKQNWIKMYGSLRFTGGNGDQQSIRVPRGEYLINRLRNRDVRERVFGPATHKQKLKQQSAAISRLFKRLHVRGLLAKIPHTRRWRLTPKGRQTVWITLKTYHQGAPRGLKEMGA